MTTMNDNDNPPQEPVESAPALDDVLRRVEGEYQEMPGMCVTRKQAQRLWGLDSTTCELVLTTLLERGVVRRTSRGMFVKY
jgi:hypothetical protein